MPESPFLIAEEAAEYTRLTTGALYTQRHRGDNPGALGVRVGKRILWRREDLDAWFESELNNQRAGVA